MSDSAEKRPPGPPRDLLEAARIAFTNAYTPYSGFHVGAAVRADDGTVTAGSNVENASYGLSRCAEQSAVQALVSGGRRHFQEVLVYTEAEEPATPCGACRQILNEFAPDAVVYLVNHRGVCRRFLVRDLLPAAFSLRVDAERQE